MARRGAQWDLWSSGAGDGGAVYGVVSLVQAHDAADDGRGVRGAVECGDDQPVGAGHDSGGRRACRGSPYRTCTSKRWRHLDEPSVASGRQAGVVMGGGDELGDGVCGAAVTRWPVARALLGRDVCRHPGDGSLQCLQLVPGAVASGVLGATCCGISTAMRDRGGCSEEMGDALLAQAHQMVDVVASGARRAHCNARRFAPP